jgi:hypothetical protein
MARKEDEGMPTITLDTLVRRNDDVFSGVVDNETVAMNVQNGKYYHLNETGSRIFALLEEPRSVQALCVELRSQFQADEEILHRDVITFLGEMADMGLIEIE